MLSNDLLFRKGVWTLFLTTFLSRQLRPPYIGNNGRVVTFLNTVNLPGDARILDIDIQPDGKILAVGQATSGGGGKSGFVLRYNANGTLDNSFSGDGILAGNNQDVNFPTSSVVVEFVDYPGSQAGHIAVLSYGKVAPSQTSDFNFSVMDAFSGNFIQQQSLVFDFNNQNDVATSMIVSPERGWVVVAGTTKPVGNLSAPADSVLARLTYPLPGNQPTTLDPTFGDNGKLLVDLPAVEGNSADERIDNITLQPDGKILAGGLAKPQGPPGPVLLARFENGVGIQLRINKTVEDDILKPGDPVSYLIQFTAGPEDASVVITDILPSEIVNYSYEVINGVVATPTGSSDYVWEVFVPGGGGGIKVSGFITDAIATDTTILNQASIAMSDTVVESLVVPARIDATPPTTSLDETPTNPDTDVTPTFSFSGNDGNGSGIAGFECSVDNASFSSCASPFIGEFGGGEHNFAVRAIDRVGFVDTTPVSYTWTIETLVITETETVSQSFDSSNGITATVTVPAGAVVLDGDVELGFSTVVTTGLPAAPGAGTLVAGFEIDLVVNGEVQAGVVFSKPITITLAYDGDLVTDPAQVQLFYLNSEGQWSSDGITLVEPISNPLIVQITHLTTFALIEASDQSYIFMPVIEQAPASED